MERQEPLDADLVVLDPAMPGGTALIRTLREATDARALVRSDDCAPETVPTALRTGAVGHLREDTLTAGRREQRILTLIAAGRPTRELCYSERTVKNVPHDVVVKLNARSRSQAVAHPVREGLI